VSDELKPTAGGWAAHDNGEVIVIRARDGSRLAQLTFLTANGRRHVGEAAANARLIAEAGTVYHETGLTPRHLVEQRDALRDALEPFAAVAEHDIGEGEADIDLFRPMNHNRAPLLTVGDLRRARAALAKLEQQP
jgi:hypothetical protein